MKMPRRLFSVFAGCFTLFLIGTAFAVRADEKDDLEKQRAEELKRVEAMLKASIDALIAKEKADPNDAKSLYELAVRCWNGDGVEMNLFAAVDLYQRAAEMGYAEAQYTYGMAYLKTLHEILPRAAAKAEGVKWLQKAAEQGHEKAQLALAKCYATGEGVKKDEVEAFKIYRKAADAGSAEALYELHVFYNLGWGGGTVDKTKAAEALRKSAEMGYVEAQRSLGLHSQHAYNGQAIDLAEAVKWYRLAAAQGDSSSKAYLEHLKDVIPLLEPAKKGDVEAQYKLAHYIADHDEIGNISDDSRSDAIRKWLLKAAENGHLAAQVELAESYGYFENGNWWITRVNDFAEAAKWYRKAAEQGDPMALGMLGWLYATGRGVDKDLKTAVEWFRKGAAQGNAEALFGMGFSLLESWLEPYDEDKDWETVVDWYAKAADSGLKHELPELENKRDYTCLQCKIAYMYRNRYNLVRALKDREPYKSEPMDQYRAEVVKWFRKAAEAGDDEGHFELVELAAERDSEAAKDALRQLAENGDDYARSVVKEHGWDKPAAGQDASEQE